KVRGAAAGSSTGDNTNVPNVSPKANASPEAKENSAIVPPTVDNKEWTIDIKGDSQPGQAPFTATLIFKLPVQDGAVTGEVWEGVTPQRLSNVTGTHKPLPGDDHWFMALDFMWGNVNITLFGVTVDTPETVLFNGRYKASALAAASLKSSTASLDPVS